MPVDGEPVGHGLGDARADSLDARELVGGRGLDAVHRAEVLRESACRGRPDMADRQRHQDPPQRLALGVVEVLDELAADDRQHSTVDDARRRQGVRIGELGLLRCPREQRDSRHVGG
jgi:hypothetical protein